MRKLAHKAAVVMIVAWLEAFSVATLRQSRLSCCMSAAQLGLRGGRGSPRCDDGEVVQVSWQGEGGSECMACGVWDAGGWVDPQDGLFYCSACWLGEEDFSIFDRRWLRAEDQAPMDQSASEVGELKVVSYNILGEYHALRPLHDYCPLELRVWGGDSGRAKRISDEVVFYDGDVVCMQEVTPRMYDLELKHLLGDSYDGFHSAMSPDAEAEDVVPASSAQDEAVAKGKALDDIGLATFVKRSKYTVDAWQSCELHEYLPCDRPVGALRDKLIALSSSVVLVLVRCRGTQRPVLVANTQLFWHPESPHVKALQADLVCLAVSDFLARQASTSVPVVLCGDFNSVPEMVLDYLPLRQQEFLCSLMDAQDGVEKEEAGTEGHGVEAQTVRGIQNLPEEHQCSGVLELLHSSRLRQDHPEHPDSFGKGWEGPGGGKPFSTMSYEEKKLMRKLKKQQHRWNPSSQGHAVLYGDLSTHGLSLQHAYAAAWKQVQGHGSPGGHGSRSRRDQGGEWAEQGAAGAQRHSDEEGIRERSAARHASAATAGPTRCSISRALPMTTCTPSFCGSIDHIWHSRGLRLRATLQLPYACSEPAPHGSPTGALGSRLHDFPYIPNHVFASDHLAIGAMYILPGPARP